MAVTCASFAYPELDTETRGRIADRLAEATPVPDLFILTTCLRIEVAAPTPAEALTSRLDDLLGAIEVPPPNLHTDRDAVLHLFRIAAGLESPVLGEREILTQFRQALLDAADCAGLDGAFVKLLQAGIGAGRRARELMPARPHESLATVAAELVTDADRVAVLGAGDMAMAVIRHLASRPSPPKVVILARRPEHVTADMAEVWPFDRLTEVLTGYPAVISATSASTELISQAGLAAALQSRSDELTLVDMSMPPDFAPPDDPRVTHYNIDDLARRAAAQPWPAEAEAAVAEAAGKAFRRFAGHEQIGPLVGRLVSEADAIVDAAVERFATKLTDADDAAVLRQTAHTVARALLARPIAHLNGNDVEPVDIEVIARAFQTRRG